MSMSVHYIVSAVMMHFVTAPRLFTNPADSQAIPQVIAHPAPFGGAHKPLPCCTC